MSREIKFRAWDKDHKKMFYDVSVDDNKFCVRRDADGLLSISGKIAGDSCIIIEQFTGLKDKNGKEIYEGDEVKGHGLWGSTTDSDVVISHNGAEVEIGDSWINLARFIEIEIIGNIHETRNS